MPTGVEIAFIKILWYSIFEVIVANGNSNVEVIRIGIGTFGSHAR